MAKSFTRSKKRSEMTSKVLSYIVLGIAVLLVLAPFSIVIALSFQSHSQAVNPPFRFFEGPFGFDEFSIAFRESYAEFIAEKWVWNGLKNTLIIVVPIMFSGVLFSALSAFAFAKLRFKSKKIMFAILLGSMMLPGIITMTPAFFIYDLLGWINNIDEPALAFLPLMLPNMLGTAACTFYLTQYFKGIPDELIEAARVDGLGNYGIFTKIFLPLSLPALIAQILLWFIAGYNDYLGPLLYIGDEQFYTLQLVLKLTSGNADTNLPKVMAACIIVMAPVLILYLVFQEYFLKGIALSSGKED
jgi:multiple sugar transport system permease protein